MNKLISLCFIFVSLLPLQAGVLINEVLYDGLGADHDDVFTELVIDGEVSLDGWSLRGINGNDGKVYRTISLSDAVIPVDGVLVIATSTALGEVLMNRDFIANVDWQNGADAIQLIDPDNHIVDALQYGDAGIYNAGEGRVAEDISAGFSLSRNSFAVDTNDNYTDFIQSVATPGVGPMSGASLNPVPEPKVYGLSLLGLLAVGFMRKRSRERKN